MLDGVAVQAAGLQPLQPGIVGGEAVLLGARPAEPERHHAPHHRLDHEDVLGLTNLESCGVWLYDFFGDHLIYCVTAGELFLSTTV